MRHRRAPSSSRTTATSGRDPLFARLPPPERQRRDDRRCDWIREAGHARPRRSAITNTHSVGVVRDALVERLVGRRAGRRAGLVAAGGGRDLRRLPQRHQRLPRAAPSTCAQALGRGDGGTGRRGQRRRRHRHDLPRLQGRHRHLVAGRRRRGGRLHGRRAGAGQLRPREQLRVDGVPVGADRPDAIPQPARRPPRRATGSIIVMVATDAPLLPNQCTRLAQRAALGIARMGGTGENSSGDLFLAFATGNRGLRAGSTASRPVPLSMLPRRLIDAAVRRRGRRHPGGDPERHAGLPHDARPRRLDGSRPRPAAPARGDGGRLRPNARRPFTHAGAGETHGHRTGDQGGRDDIHHR